MKYNFYLSFLLITTCILNGCSKDISSDENILNACIEWGNTKVFESSKRMDILKNYGFSPATAYELEDKMDLKWQMKQNSVGTSIYERIEQCEVKHPEFSCPGLLKKIHKGISYIEEEMTFAACSLGMTVEEMLEKL